MLHGVTSFQLDATPICDLPQSSSVIPTARNIARAPARSMPSVTSRLRGLMSVMAIERTGGRSVVRVTFLLVGTSDGVVPFTDGVAGPTELAGRHVFAPRAGTRRVVGDRRPGTRWSSATPTGGGATSPPSRSSSRASSRGPAGRPAGPATGACCGSTTVAGHRSRRSTLSTVGRRGTRSVAPSPTSAPSPRPPMTARCSRTCTSAGSPGRATAGRHGSRRSTPTPTSTRCAPTPTIRASSSRRPRSASL